MSFSATKAPCEPIYRKFGIPKLKDQISLFNCLFVHDQTHKLLPSSFDNFFAPMILVLEEELDPHSLLM